MIFGSRVRAFTFPEALVTIALMVVFTALVGGVFFQGRTLAERLEAEDRLLQEKVSLTTTLAVLCQQVHPPEWAASDQVFTTSAQGLTVKYWNADPQQTLSFAVVGGTLRVQAGDGVFSWKILKALGVDYWKASDRVVGLVVHWTEAGDQHELHLAWGGRPL